MLINYDFARITISKKSTYNISFFIQSGRVNKKNLLLKRRIKRFDKMYAALVKNDSILTKKQKEEIDTFWHVFTPVRYSSFKFYTEKTGTFDIRYIPDSLHRSIIDVFFNDWTAAKYLDNKCYYPLIFQNVSIPKTIVF